MSRTTEFTERVVAIVTATGPGELLTYGEVAAEAGRPGAARAVGSIMASWPGELPWWRVVRADGRLLAGREHEHAQHLLAEGIAVSGHRLPAARHR